MEKGFNEKVFSSQMASWLSMGYSVNKKLFQDIGNGDMKAARGSNADYIAAMRDLLGEDLVFAKDCAYIHFVEVSTVGILNGLESWAAYGLKKGYYYAVETAESVPEVLEYMKNFTLDFTEAVYRAKIESRYSPIIREACEYIYQHMGEKLTIQMVAEKTHFSKSYISHKFKEEVGMSIMDYLIHLRIEEAKSMLHQHIPISAIAQDLGFSSQSHFTRVFHTRIGMTPGDWSKRI